MAGAETVASHLETGQDHVLPGNGDIGMSVGRAEVENGVQSQFKLWTGPYERAPYWLHLLNSSVGNVANNISDIYSSGTKIVTNRYSSGTKIVTNRYSSGTKIVTNRYSSGTKILTNRYSSGTKITDSCPHHYIILL